MVSIERSGSGGKARITVGIRLTRQESPSYPIIIEKGIFAGIPDDLEKRGLGNRFAIITDSNVLRMYGTRLEAGLRKAGFKAETFSFPAGEPSKRLSVCEEIADGMSAAGLGRDTVVVALGGGVVGDMAGFIASCFNRGVPYVQIPTTLVAQADSSIGGKTAVDTKMGKNLFGTFKQPNVVYIDTSTLMGLPQAEYRCGLAETVKHAVISDREFFAYLEDNVHDIMQMKGGALLRIAEANCKIKGAVIENDAYEAGLRMTLNFGHTIGHAIERLSDYTMPHGKCVSIGMIVEMKIANAVGGFPKKDMGRVKALLEAFGLPTRVPDGISSESIMATATLDKKSRGGKERYSIPSRLGVMAAFGGDYSVHVDERTVREALDGSR